MGVVRGDTRSLVLAVPRKSQKASKHWSYHLMR